MAELKKHAWLLIIIAILALIKFAVIPIFTWQDSLLADITLLEKKQNKIDTLLKYQEANSRINKQLTQLLLPTKALFYPPQKESAFKLKQQEKLESLLAKHNLQVEHVGWQASTPFNKLAMVRYPIEIRFKGKTLNTIEFMTTLEKLIPRIEINDFNISFRGQINQNLGQVTAKITLYLYVKEFGFKALDEKEKSEKEKTQQLSFISKERVSSITENSVTKLLVKTIPYYQPTFYRWHNVV